MPKVQVKPGDILVHREWLHLIDSDWPKEYVEIGRYLILEREINRGIAGRDRPKIQFRTVLLYVHPKIAGPGIMPPDRYILAENELTEGDWKVE